MRVLRILVSLEQAAGGAPRAAVRGAQAVAEAGIPCDLLAPEPRGPRIPTSLPIISYPVQKSAWRGRSPSLPRILEDILPRYDLVHIDELWHYPHYAAAKEAQRLGKPYVITPHGELAAWMMAYKGIRKTLYWKFIQKDLLQKAAAIHAITASEEARIRELGIQAPTCVVPNGVFLPHEGGALPPDFPKGSIVLFVGRIHPVKGLDVLLEAFARVTYPCTLVVAGPDPDGQWANLKLRVPHAKVVFLGCVDDADLGAVYRRADILVLPSRSEVLGLVTLEAMAHRVPVLISPFCGLSERDLAGAGEIVDLDPNLLARAIEALLANPDRRARMGEAGLQLVRDRYAWDAIGRSLADLYKGLGQAS